MYEFNIGDRVLVKQRPGNRYIIIDRDHIAFSPVYFLNIITPNWVDEEDLIKIIPINCPEYFNEI